MFQIFRDIGYCRYSVHYVFLCSLSVQKIPEARHQGMHNRSHPLHVPLTTNISKPKSVHCSRCAASAPSVMKSHSAACSAAAVYTVGAVRCGADVAAAARRCSSAPLGHACPIPELHTWLPLRSSILIHPCCSSGNRTLRLIGRVGPCCHRSQLYFN